MDVCHTVGFIPKFRNLDLAIQRHIPSWNRQSIDWWGQMGRFVMGPSVLIFIFRRNWIKSF
jgi:hypothetical protein